MTIRVIVADDHQIVRNGIRLLLEDQDDIKVVAEAHTGRVCLDLVAEHRPDVVLMDISMPDMDGLAASREITRQWPDVRILGLTMHQEEEYVLRLLRAGAAGYVVKDVAPEELVSAVYAVARGEAYIQSNVAVHVVAGVRQQPAAPRSPMPTLTQRELEVLALIAEGLTARRIGARLNISGHTVERHRANIMNKLDVHNKVELITYALREGLVRPGL